MVEALDPAIRPISDYVATIIAEQKSVNRRFLLGIVGAPASGKSTFAAEVVEKINSAIGSDKAIVVPMDGFHYSNDELIKRDLLPLKGIPATFDAASFVSLIEEIKSTSDRSVFCPLFDRSIEASIPGAIEIKPQHQIIVAEGNYLLLEAAPWNKLKAQFDQIWYIDADIETLMPRLIERHRVGGRDPKQSQEKMESTDLPNAQLVYSTRNRADKRIR